MGVLPLDSLMPIVRLRIYEALTIDGHDLVDADYIAVEVDEDVTPGYVKMAFRQLQATGEVEYEVRKSSVGIETWTGKVSITAKGLRVVEKDLNNTDSIAFAFQANGLDGSKIPFVSSAIAPASDRVVLYSDNEPKADRARTAVEALKTRIETTNDLPGGLVKFKEIVLVELESLQSLIIQSAVRASVVLTLARKILPWIADKAGGAAVGELAKQALAALLSWLS